MTAFDEKSNKFVVIWWIEVILNKHDIGCSFRDHLFPSVSYVSNLLGALAKYAVALVVVDVSPLCYVISVRIVWDFIRRSRSFIGKCVNF